MQRVLTRSIFRTPWRACAARFLIASVCGVVLVVVSAALLTDSAWAQVTPVRVYATYGPTDRGPGGPIGLAPTESVELSLWASGGELPSAQTVCVDGTGDEICGLDVQIVATGGFEITGFVGNPTFDTGPARLPFVVSPLPATSFSFNSFDLGTPTPAHRWIGSFVVSAPSLAAGAQISVSGEAVGANLEIRSILAETLIVPEPGLAMACTLGVALLAGLGHARTRRMPRSTRGSTSRPSPE